MPIKMKKRYWSKQPDTINPDRRQNMIKYSKSELIQLGKGCSLAELTNVGVNIRMVERIDEMPESIEVLPMRINIIPKQINLMPAFAKNIFDEQTPDQNQQHQHHQHGHNSKKHTHGKKRNKNTDRKQKSNENKTNETKPDIVHITLEIKGAVQLDKAVNAWKPRALVATGTSPPTDATVELCKGVRSILNKLTYDNFDVLLEQIKSFNIDTIEKLNSVILLVFEKAVDEPNFSQAYAELCKNLVHNCFPVESDSHALFKRTLITKCQNEFTKNVCADTANEQQLKPLRDELATCTDPDGRYELSVIINDEEQKMRRKTVCTVQFIGELFLFDMLTTSIMERCIKALLDGRTDEKLECLCKLLTTVGEKLEATSKPIEKGTKSPLALCMQQMHDMANKKIKFPLSNRIRFMIMDVIDLRKKKWLSNRN